MKKILTVLDGFRHMGASPSQLASEFFKLMTDDYYRDEWFHIITGGSHE